MIVAVRQRTLLPLDDVMDCLRDAIPERTRSPCTVVCSVTACPGGPSARTRHPSEAASPKPRSASSTSTAVSGAWQRPGSSWSWPSTGFQSSLSSSSTRTLDRLLHHAVVAQIEGASYRRRQHADLIPEALRPKSVSTPAAAPPRPAAEEPRYDPFLKPRPLFDPPEAGRNHRDGFRPDGFHRPWRAGAVQDVEGAAAQRAPRAMFLICRPMRDQRGIPLLLAHHQHRCRA